MGSTSSAIAQSGFSDVLGTRYVHRTRHVKMAAASLEFSFEVAMAGEVLAQLVDYCRRTAVAARDLHMLLD